MWLVMLLFEMKHTFFFKMKNAEVHLVMDVLKCAVEEVYCKIDGRK